MKFNVFQLSRIGGREKNEDRMGYCYTREASLFLLADGMGGHPEGEVAARLALQTIAALFQGRAVNGLGDTAFFLAEALLAAHEEIKRYALQTRAEETPRTTLVAALIQGGELTWIHCGDSRLYLTRAGELLARTRDHSFVERPHLQGPEPGNHHNRNILFTCLGCPGSPVYDLAGPIELRQGDKVMLCSDGLWDSLSEQEILLQLGQAPVADAVPLLVERALLRAGASSDNVTALALEWEAQHADEASDASVFTDSLAPGEVSSTLHAGRAWSAVDELDDAAIDRSIAEINEVIRLAAAKRR